MIDRFRLKDVLAQYKQNFVSKQWGEEKYKWEAVKWFQDNWDVNASDFAEMLDRSLDKTYNLLASANNFPKGMIIGFAKSAPEEVRAMFLSLYDESKDVYERMNAFKMQSTVLLEKYGNGAAQHYQYENAISTYLWLRFPDKYYIYKFGEVKTVASELEADYHFKKGAYADNIRNFLKLYDEISAALKEDTELVNLFQSQLTDTCYPDPELKTLTVDVGFYISRYYSQKDAFAAVTTEWYGSNYDPGLSVEDWLKLLKDESVFTTGALEIMKRIKDYGGMASCTQLAVKYGETKNFYNSGSVALARRICEATGITPAVREDGSTQWWTILYTGRDAVKMRMVALSGNCETSFQRLLIKQISAGSNCMLLRLLVNKTAAIGGSPPIRRFGAFPTLPWARFSPILFTMRTATNAVFSRTFLMRRPVT